MKMGAIKSKARDDFAIMPRCYFGLTCCSPVTKSVKGYTARPTITLFQFTYKPAGMNAYSTPQT